MIPKQAYSLIGKTPEYESGDERSSRSMLAFIEKKNRRQIATLSEARGETLTRYEAVAPPQTSLFWFLSSLF